MRLQACDVYQARLDDAIARVSLVLMREHVIIAQDVLRFVRVLDQRSQRPAEAALHLTAELSPEQRVDISARNAKLDRTRLRQLLRWRYVFARLDYLGGRVLWHPCNADRKHTRNQCCCIRLIAHIIPPILPYFPSLN